MTQDMAHAGQSPLHKARRIVIKIGSALLIDSERNEIRHPWLLALIEDVVNLREQGKEVIIVTSGSVGLGKRILNITGKPLRLEESQAAAACGQVRLMQAYQQILAWHNISAAQILLTLDDTENRQSYLNVRATLRSLLEMNAVPVINENDTVASPTARYGDNDRLAARVATMIEADCLILLSDIDGLYTADPQVDSTARFIPEIEELTPEIIAMGGEPRSGFGSGGMRTKIEAARIATASGCAMAVARGTVTHPIKAVWDGSRCSWFLPKISPSAARKTWIGGSLHALGQLAIDAGAATALGQGKSLLAVGVTKVTGTFERGDLVSVVAPNGREIARGLSSYSYQDAVKIIGKRSDQFAVLLGYNGKDEIIHRDDMAVL